MSADGKVIKAFSECNQKGQEWLSFALIGKLAVSDENKFEEECRGMHVTEEQLGLELAKAGQ